MRFDINWEFIGRSISSKIREFVADIPPFVRYIWIILLIAAIYPLASAVMKMGAKKIYAMMLGEKKNQMIKPVPQGFFEQWNMQFDANSMLVEFQKYEKYGKIVEFYLGFTRFILITDPDIAREILLKRPKQFCRLQDPEGSKFIGLDQSVLDLEGPEWMKVRKIFNPTFTKSHISKCYEKIVAEAYRWMQRLSNISGQLNSPNTVDMTFEPFTFTIRVISTIAFGVSSTEVNSFNSYFFSSQLFEDIRALLNYSDISIRELFRVFPWKSFQFHMQHQVPTQKASLRFTEHCWEVIEHILNQKGFKSANENEEDSSLIENLIASYKKGAITADELLANVKVAYIGGTDTTAVTISWSCYYLSLYPEYREKIHEEFQNLFPAQNHDILNLSEGELIKYLTVDQVQNTLPFTQAFVKETLRLKPPVPNMIIKTLQDEITLSNQMSVAKDDNLVINQEGMMRLPEIFDDPMVFYPFRWLVNDKDEVLAKMNQAFMPFGGGARICPGKILSLEESVIAVGLLASCFEMSLACDHTEIERVVNLIAAPNKMPILLKAIH